MPTPEAASASAEPVLRTVVGKTSTASIVTNGQHVAMNVLPTTTIVVDSQVTPIGP